MAISSIRVVWPSSDYLIIKQLLEGNFNYFGMGYTKERYASFYASANYSFNDKYVLNATTRMDGSKQTRRSRAPRDGCPPGT